MTTDHHGAHGGHGENLAMENWVRCSFGGFLLMLSPCRRG